ncbi:coagulation factor XI-like [Cololabis saira]|uniref:coagulation factor XI-like n=1 Tax=Cololabis saira TaxID=129043 RepID=UPI002AD2E8E9|nr:coagulation factor XI-like [Cololabis saira]
MGAFLVLLGLLSLCTLSSGQECNQEILENVDFPGTDITFLYSPDVEHCQQLCTQHPSCLFFTFVRADWTTDNRNFYCYLKSTPSGQPASRSPLLGVTSGFSLKQCNPDPQPCLSEMYDNVDFKGADYRTLFTSSYEDCQRVCTEDPDCRFFTFVKNDFTVKNIRYKCHLKFSWNIPRTPIVESKTGVTSGFSKNAKLTPHFDTACESTFFPNTDLPGSDLQVLKAVSAEHCQILCSAHPQCTYFSFTNFDCFLKNNPNTMEARAKDGIKSGLAAHSCHLDDSLVKIAYEEIDFRGSDIRFELMDDADMCQSKCTEDPVCQFYTYVDKQFSDRAFWRRCYLKRVITMPAPPKVEKLVGVLSGFSQRNCETAAR